jgi:hypothetical protein
VRGRLALRLAQVPTRARTEGVAVTAEEFWAIAYARKELAWSYALKRRNLVAAKRLREWHANEWAVV